MSDSRNSSGKHGDEILIANRYRLKKKLNIEKKEKNADGAKKECEKKGSSIYLVEDIKNDNEL